MTGTTTDATPDTVPSVSCSVCHVRADEPEASLERWDRYSGQPYWLCTDTEACLWRVLGAPRPETLQEGPQGLTCPRCGFSSSKPTAEERAAETYDHWRSHKPEPGKHAAPAEGNGQTAPAAEAPVAEDAQAGAEGEAAQ